MVGGALTTKNDQLNSLSCFEEEVWGNELHSSLVGLLKNQPPTLSPYLVNKSLFNTWDYWCDIVTSGSNFGVSNFSVLLLRLLGFLMYLCLPLKFYVHFCHLWTVCTLQCTHKLSKYVNFCISLTVQLLVLAGVHNFWFLFNHLCFVLCLYVTSDAFECVRLHCFLYLFANLSNVNKLFKITLLLALLNKLLWKFTFLCGKKRHC